MGGLSGLSGLSGEPAIFKLGYWLEVRFDADDQPYVNGQRLDTVLEGISKGTGYIVEVDGTASIVSEEFVLTPQAAPGWGRLGAHFEKDVQDGLGAFTRQLGLALVGEVEVGATGAQLLFPQWKDAADVSDQNRIYEFYVAAAAALQVIVRDGANPDNNLEVNIVATYAATTPYALYILLGGYDANGVPFHLGENPADYLYGAAFLIAGGAFSDVTLLWRTALLNTASLYAAISNYNAAVNADEILIPRRLFRGVFQPSIKDSFTGDNGTALPAHTPEVGGVWAGATWDIQSNKARNQPTAGADLVTNGDFAAWVGDNPTGWTITGVEDALNEVSEVGAGQGHGGAGNGLANLFRTTIPIHIRQTILTIGGWYIVTVDVDTVIAAGGVFVRDIVGGLSRSVTTIGAKIFTGRANHATLELKPHTNGTDITVDNVAVKALTPSTLFAYQSDSGLSDFHAIADLTLTAGTQCGMGLCLDSVTNPQNFIIAYHDGTDAHLEKCVAGTYTSLIDAAAAYGAGKRLIVIKSGSSVSLFYDGAKVGTTQTVSDAGIVDNTIHGNFSTYVDNRVDNFHLLPLTCGAYEGLRHA